MATSKRLTVRLSPDDLARLRQFPGNSDADRVRAALWRGGAIDAIIASQREDLTAMRGEIADAIADASGGDGLAKTLAQALAVAIADGLAPTADPERRRRLSAVARKLAVAAGLRIAPTPAAPPAPKQSNDPILAPILARLREQGTIPK